MEFTPRKINVFTLLKLPSAYFTGVRLKEINNERAVAKVKFRWINQNPFKSMFWAVQGMASELTTGVLVMKNIEASGKRISMLVTNMDATFTKKARGVITFECNQGALIQQTIEKAVATNQGQTVTITSKGVDENGDVVSSFNYEWSVKVKCNS